MKTKTKNLRFRAFEKRVPGVNEACDGKLQLGSILKQTNKVCEQF